MKLRSFCGCSSLYNLKFRTEACVSGSNAMLPAQSPCELSWFKASFWESTRTVVKFGSDYPANARSRIVARANTDLLRKGFMLRLLQLYSLPARILIPNAVHVYCVASAGGPYRSACRHGIPSLLCLEKGSPSSLAATRLGERPPEQRQKHDISRIVPLQIFNSLNP